MEFGVYDETERTLPATEEFQESRYEIRQCRLDTAASAYQDKVGTILQNIRLGNVYQVNLTVRLHFRFVGDPRDLFLSVSRSQPVENAALIRNGGEWILSSSPELFFRLCNGQISVRPMKGTIGRGRTSAELRTWI